MQYHVNVAWAVRLWPRDEWPYLPDHTPGADGSITVYIGERMLAEQYLSLVPMLAVIKPWEMEAHAGRAKLVMVPVRVEAGLN